MGPSRVASPAPAPVRRASAFAAALLLLACGGDGPTDPPPTGTLATELVKVGGDGQDWYFDNPLPEPYGVVARDSAGLAVPDVAVTWTVTLGAGAIAPTLGVTGSDGVASATHTLGLTGAVQRVSASATGLAAVEFESTAMSPPTSVGVQVRNDNDSFSPADVVVKVNGTVTWTWISTGESHNVYYASGPPSRPPDSPTQDSGMHTSTFTAVGRYPYFCNLHAGMSGTVTVVR